MNYEQKYKEALERARKLKENPKAIFFEEKNVHVSDYIFPELKESEDERIRKALIKYFTLSDDNADYQCCGVHCKDIVAWLEKRKDTLKNIEQKTAWSEEDEEIRLDAIYFIERFRKELAKGENDFQNAVTCEDWLTSLKYRLHWKPTKNQLKSFDEILENHGGNFSTANYETMKELYEQLKELKL